MVKKYQKLFDNGGSGLGIAAVILFERDEQKDKSGKPALAFSLGNPQIKKYKNQTQINFMSCLVKF